MLKATNWILTTALSKLSVRLSDDTNIISFSALDIFQNILEVLLLELINSWSLHELLQFFNFYNEIP